MKKEGAKRKNVYKKQGVTVTQSYTPSFSFMVPQLPHQKTKQTQTKKIKGLCSKVLSTPPSPNPPHPKMQTKQQNKNSPTNRYIYI